MPASEADPVLVCGAGAAGMAAAIGAARAGAAVHLVEQSSAPGGTMVHALLHTLAGLYDGRGEYVNDGLARELAERLLAADPHVRRRRMGKLWVLNVEPALYGRITTEWLAEQPGITLRCSTSVASVERASDRVRAVTLTTRGVTERLQVAALVDASGGAELAARIDPALRAEEKSVAAGGWVFRMRGVAEGAFAFPRNVAVVRELRERAARGELPAECAHAWIDSGIHPDELFVKLFVPLEPGWQDQEITGGVSENARRTERLVAEFLVTLKGFENARVTQSGSLGVRDGGRICGEYTLTKSDVLKLARFEDAACRCAWPVEYWDSRTGVSLEYLPEGEYYEIPMRALKLRSVANVWAAGKCLSADVHAQASARCVGTCWAMGAAVGAAAADAWRLQARRSTSEEAV